MEINPKQLRDFIEKAKNGDQHAFNFLLDRYWNDVYGFQLKRIQNENDAEDVTIQTFSRAFDKLDTFDPSYSFKTWLITISKNIHIDLLRKKKASIRSQTTYEEDDEVYGIADDAPSVEDALITEQNLAQLLRDIKKLKPNYQKVIHLRYFQEMSYKEISEELHEPMSNIKVKLLRAKKLLAGIIKNREV
ncbi:MAG TPA: sigma-70 family RNA polymerase sigma factor [Salinimicrobium sp.]|nr:sigma-70 family RNA polymerase sigma factor [Salinimicrobium sp.]